MKLFIFLIIVASRTVLLCGQDDPKISEKTALSEIQKLLDDIKKFQLNVDNQLKDVVQPIDEKLIRKRTRIGLDMLKQKANKPDIVQCKSNFTTSKKNFEQDLHEMLKIKLKEQAKNLTALTDNLRKIQMSLREKDKDESFYNCKHCNLKLDDSKTLKEVIELMKANLRRFTSNELSNFLLEPVIGGRFEHLVYNPVSACLKPL